MSAMKGQPAPKPGALKGPVAAKNAQSDVDAMLAEFDPPDVAATGGSEADALLSEFDAEATPAGVPGPDEFAPQPGFVEANVMQHDPETFITRLQAGLAANDTEKVNFLKKKYGEGNVAMKDEKIYYRKDPKAKLKPLDPDTFELIADIIPDFAREAITEVSMIPGEIGGGIAGAVLGTPTAPGIGSVAGAVMGMTAGRVASVPIANKVADKVAEFAGVPQDENRSGLLENGIGMATEAVLPVVGRTVGKQIMKRIPGTSAYKMAQEAGEKEVVRLSRQSEEVAAAAADLEREGIEVNMMAQQRHNTAPQLEAKAQDVEIMPEFTKKQQEFAEGYGQALEKNLTEIVRRSNPGGPAEPGKLASTITNAVEGLDRAEGKAIGNFRAKSLAQTKNAKQQLPPEVTDEVVSVMKELGFQPRRKVLNSVTRPGTVGGVMQRGATQATNKIERVEWVPPKDMQAVVGRLGIDDPGQVRAVVNILNEYGQLISRGNEARLTDVERIITRMGPMNRKLGNSGLAGTWGRMTGNLRQFRREMIGNGLSDNYERAAFEKTMDDFSMIRQNTDQLSNLLRGDVTSKTVVNGFFKGKENLANVRALRSILGNDSAQWGQLKEEFVNQLMLKHSSDGPTGFNSKAFLNDLEKNYGDDFAREVLDNGTGPNLKTIKNLLTVGQRIEATQRGMKLDKTGEAAGRAATEGFFGILLNSPYRMINATAKLLGVAGDKESVLMELIAKDGVEKYLNTYKGSSRAKQEIANKVEMLLSDYQMRRQANRKAAEVLDIGKDVLKRGTKATIREDAMRSD